MCDVLVGVEIVGQGELIQSGKFRCDDFPGRLNALKQRPTELCKLQVPFAGNDIVCELHDRLLIDLEADFRSTEYDDDVGP